MKECKGCKTPISNWRDYCGACAIQRGWNEGDLTEKDAMMLLRLGAE